MRGRVSPIKVHAFHPSILLLWPWISHAGENFTYHSSCIVSFALTTLQISPFMPSVSHTGESHLSRDFTFLAHSISCGVKPLIKKFTHLILHLYLFRPALSISYGGPIKVHASDPSPFILCGGEFYLSRFTQLVPRLCQYPVRKRESTIKRFTHLILGFITWTSDYLADLILPALNISCVGESSYQEVHAFDSLAWSSPCWPPRRLTSLLPRRLAASSISTRNTSVLPLIRQHSFPIFLYGSRGFTEATQKPGYHVLRGAWVSNSCYQYPCSGFHHLSRGRTLQTTFA